ncbi:MAG TPA: hypothetical protein VN736_08465 [Candidatus Limnocylindrales bacterium]|nr:hypothetical protein [Candidatus Limnocylindrales bacterium]
MAQSPTDAPIQNLATDSHGTTLYFTTSLRQRGTTQSGISKVFGLSGTQLRLIQGSSFNTVIPGAPIYLRPSVSGDEKVLAINWYAYCLGGSFCLFQNSNSTLIRTPSGDMPLAGVAEVSRNGRFVLQYGTGHPGAPGFPDVPGQVNLLDLTSATMTQVGQDLGGSGRHVANDGTTLIRTGSTFQLVGPNGAVPVTPAFPIVDVQLSADAGKVVYDTTPTGGGIRLLDVASGADRLLTTGSFPTLADDGRRFSYLNGNQAWLGDALSGPIAALTNEAEGIADQTITGDGTTVFAATYSGRVLSIDSGSGKVTQLLDSPPAKFLQLAATPVPGSYNWLIGTNDSSLQIRVNGAPVIRLGALPDRVPFQLPWEVAPDPSAVTVVWGAEPAWEQLVATGVAAVAGVTLNLDSAYDAGIHQDWSRLVTKSDPARPGEIIHMYGTGWGPVDGVVTSGQPTPADRLYEITAPCQWSAMGDFGQPERPFDVLFAGLAPGLIGLYQLDFLIPLDWSSTVFNAGCRTPEGVFGFAASVPVAQ